MGIALNRTRIGLVRDYWFGLLAALTLASPAAAQFAPASVLSVKIASASMSPAPGSDVQIVIDVMPAMDEHIYWQNPGESGYAPRFTWQLPPGFSIAAVRHPAPSRMVLGGIAMNVHRGRTLLLTSLHLPATAQLGQAFKLRGSGDFLVCSEGNCQPVEVPLAVDLVVGRGESDPAGSAEVQAAQLALPTAATRIARYHVSGHGVHLTLPLPWPQTATRIELFCASDAGSVMPLPIEVRHDERELDLLLPAGSWHPKGRIGLVARIFAGSTPLETVSFDADPGAAPDAASGGVLSFLTALLGAILGGLLLNLMPCVFPILSLKALSLARAGAAPAEARAEGLGYLLGACSAMMVLGGTVLALRAGGAAVGWAFQLQSPVVIALLMLLMLAMATNLAGLFELPTIAPGTKSRSGLAGGFGTGALAAFVATPCTGPFMAGALGAAMVLPVPEALAVFAGLGLGLALPFVVIAIYEPARRWLPRPGNWMIQLRRMLAIPMFLTALGLAWLLGRLAGVPGMTVGLGAALLLGLALWWWGLRQVAGKNWIPALVPLAIALALPAIIGTPPVSTLPAAEQRLLGAMPYNAARLAELRAAHRPVFLFATADWCLTCKVNEQGSLASSTVAKAFADQGVVVMEADWTRSDADVTRFLTENGRAGVPLYIWYPASGEPRVLPQILTPGILGSLS